MNESIRNSLTLNKVYQSLRYLKSIVIDTNTKEESVKWNYLNRKAFASQNEEMRFYDYQNNCMKAAAAESVEEFKTALNAALTIVKELLPDDISTDIHYFSAKQADLMNTARRTFRKSKEDGYGSVADRNATFVAHNFIENYIYCMLNGENFAEFAEKNSKDEERLAKLQKSIKDKLNKEEQKAQKKADNSAESKTATATATAVAAA